MYLWHVEQVLLETRITIRFSELKILEDVSIRLVRGLVGLYFISLTEPMIDYPFRPSSLVYIGMSESKQNTIGNRLRDHASGQSGNPGLTNYIRTRGAKFTYLTNEILDVLGIPSIPELEGAFLRAFLTEFGSYPICNNQAGMDIRGEGRHSEFTIDWEPFAGALRLHSG